MEVLCELLHVKLLEQCLEHSISQILAVIIVLENLHERRTLTSIKNIEKSFINTTPIIWGLLYAIINVRKLHSDFIPYAIRENSYCKKEKK